MAASLPVRGSVLSSAPCSLQEAAGMLQRFLSSEGAAESGIVKGYLENVSRSLHEVISRGDKTLNQSFSDPRHSKSEEMVEDFELGVENANENAQAVMNFEALLGREDEHAFPIELDKRSNGEILSENEFEAADMVASTRSSRIADEDNVNASKRKKKKKKKNLIEASREAVTGALEGVLASAIGGKAQDEERIDKVTLVPADQEGRKKKKKKHKEKPPLENDFLTKERSDDREDDAGHLNSKSDEQDIKEKKKTKKRAADQSPGEHRVSKKSRKSG
ncbi:unnamed protein product [Sphagnum jensenii]|uniref:Uncharacterized protein n=1 Tax=Sphagnum jensenii TaxID=128206 RepID=A0ABP1BZ94_9BRYO